MSIVNRIFWVLLIWTIIVQTSCITKEKCQERYPTKDSSYTRELIISDTDTMWFAEENYYAEDVSPCPPEIKYHKETTQGRHKITVDIDNGKITAKCHDDSLMRVIDKKTRVIESYQSKQGPTQIVMKTWWVYTVACWWSVISLILLILLMAFLLIKRK